MQFKLLNKIKTGNWSGFARRAMILEYNVSSLVEPSKPFKTIRIHIRRYIKQPPREKRSLRLKKKRNGPCAIMLILARQSQTAVGIRSFVEGKGTNSIGEVKVAM